MKIQRIIILLLVFSMLFVNSNSVLAIEIQNDDVEILYTYEENITENDISTNSVGDVDSQNILAQMKPANGLYDTDNIYQKDKFATYYFSNLKENFGNNTKGSCGYVAVAMMLSYYDTYLNDDIIDDTYDKTTALSSFKLANISDSPGIRREDDSICPGYVPSPTGADAGDSLLWALDIDDYWNLIENNHNNYFHLNLIKLAEEQFNMYHDTIAVLEECGIIIEIDTQYPCATTLLHQKSVIEYYLYQVKGLEGQVSLEYVNAANTDVRNFAINKIKNGQPVMLLLGSSSGFHFVVAYDLDENGTEDTSDDTIYAHYGWDEDPLPDGTFKYYTHVNIDTDNYPWLVSALAINFDMEHSCSDNYIENEGTPSEKTYCSCYFSCHPEHEHQYELSSDDSQHKYSCNCSLYYGNYYDHDYEYISTDSNYHSIVCADCSHTITEEHNTMMQAVSGNQHAEECWDCGYIDESTREAHLFDGWVFINETTHMSRCECGARGITTASHVFTLPDKIAGRMICRGCGYTKYSGGDGGFIIMSNTKVSVNGSYILPDGNIVLVDEDVEAYLNGTLVFYDKDKLPVTQ